MSTEHRIVSPAHALQTGMIAGAAVKAGLLVWPDYDEHGNYLASMQVGVSEDGQRIRIVVQPPTEADSAGF